METTANRRSAAAGENAGMTQGPNKLWAVFMLRITISYLYCINIKTWYLWSMTKKNAVKVNEASVEMHGAPATQDAFGNLQRGLSNWI
jgi:hypothetical protein